MRALVLREWTRFENVRIEEDWPTPAVQPGTVKIRTQSVGMNFALSLRVEGKYQVKPALPHVPGIDLCGFVTEVGAGVTRFAAGDRVVAFVDYGAFAEECIAHEHRTFLLPEGIPFVQAVIFPSSWMTTYIALVWPQWGNLRFGETMLVHGAAGAVGIAALDIGKIMGATVIATCGSAQKVAVCRAHGADHVINYREEDFVARVRQVTGGVGGGMVKVTVGGDVTLRSITIDPEAVDPEDVELLQEMVQAAVNEGLRAAQDLAGSKMGDATGGLGGGLGDRAGRGGVRDAGAVVPGVDLHHHPDVPAGAAGPSQRRAEPPRPLHRLGPDPQLGHLSGERAQPGRLGLVQPQRIGDEEVLRHPRPREDLRLADRRHRQPDRPGVELAPGDLRALVGLGVRPERAAALGGGPRHPGDVAVQHVGVDDQRGGGHALVQMIQMIRVMRSHTGHTSTPAPGFPRDRRQEDLWPVGSGRPRSQPTVWRPSGTVQELESGCSRLFTPSESR
jgi:DNA-binding YbaB/EbfC family protein